jgi:hypothetical protein
MVGTSILLVSPVMGQVHGGNNGGPQIQPPRPTPRPPRPEPPQPPRPQPPRPPVRPRPILPPVAHQRLTLYPGLLAIGRPHVFTSSARNLQSYGANDLALSLVAVGRWQVCSNANYRGKCRTVTGRVLNLTLYGLGRQISSVRYLGR